MTEATRLPTVETLHAEYSNRMTMARSAHHAHAYGKMRDYYLQAEWTALMAHHLTADPAWLSLEAAARSLRVALDKLLGRTQS